MNERLVWSLKNGDLDAIREMLDTEPFDVNQLLEGRSALHYAADYGHKDVIEFLIKKVANVEVLDKHGISVLLAAIWEGHTQCVQVLITNGANTDGKYIGKI